MAFNITEKHPIETFWTAVVALSAISVPCIPHHAPYLMSVPERLSGVSYEHPFGTDEFGRDLLTRVIHGSRTVIYVILLSGLLSLIGGTVIGLVAAYFGGKTDLFLSRVIDAMQAFPDSLIGLMVAAAMGPSLFTAILSVSFFGVPMLARVVRGAALEIKEREYIQARRAVGASHLYIIWKAILPNVTTPIIIQTSTIAPRAVIDVAGLSFLGFGAQPPSCSSGAMIAQARSCMYLVY